MRITLKNNSGVKIHVSTGKLWEGIISPHEERQITCKPNGDLTLWVYVCNESQHKGSIYNLNLESQYSFGTIDSDVKFSVTHEKIRVALDVSYERLFVEAAGAMKTAEKTIVKDADRIIKRYKRNCLLELLYGPLTHFTTLSIGLFAAGILLAWLFKWWIVFLYYPFAYISLFIVHWLIDVLCKSVSKRVLKTNSFTDFYQFFDPFYISNYYSQPNREPFLGKVENK